MLKRIIVSILIALTLISLCVFGLVSCKKDEQPDVEFQFSLSNDESHYILTGVTKCNTRTLEIPAIYEGLPVKEIGSTIFIFDSSSNDEQVENIIIPEGIVTIREYAFAYCRSLKSIDIPASVTALYGSSFEGCYGLSDINIAAGNASYKIVEGNVYSIDGKVLVRCLSGRTAGAFTVPAGVTEIGSNAFSYSSALTEAILPDSVAKISENAFYYCEYLEKINIPKNVSEIRSDVFEGCYALREYAVDADNATYKSVDGNIYSKNGETLILFAKGNNNPAFIVPNGVIEIADAAFFESKMIETVYIPSSVRTIGENAFYRCQRLREVTIEYGTEKIGASAFMYCEMLDSITLPDSVTEIGKSAFNGCKSLRYACIGNGVSTIPANIFSACSSITEITLGSGVSKIESSAFQNLSSLETINIDPDNEYLTVVNNIIYTKDMTALVLYLAQDQLEYVVPEGVTTIEKNAFAAVRGPEYIIISKDVNNIEIPALAKCKNLRTIVVDGANTTYKSIEGNLYSKDGKTLLQYATGKEDELFVVPEGVTTIADHVFGEAIAAKYTFVQVGSGTIDGIFESNVSGNVETEGYKDVTFVDGVTSTVISGGSFVTNGGLANIYTTNVKVKKLLIPASVTEISTKAFVSIPTIEAVYYCGTEDEWKNIEGTSGSVASSGTGMGTIIGGSSSGSLADGEKVQFVGNGIVSLTNKLSGTTIYFYSETEPANEGNFWHYVNGTPEPWASSVANKK